MPLDPNIALSYRPVQVPDPLVTETRLANLRNLASANQLQQARLTAVGQANAERAQATQDDNTIRQSWLDAGGDLGKASQLALQRGASPTAVTGFENQVTAAKQKTAALDTTTIANQQAKNNSLAGLLDPVAKEPDPAKQEKLWNQALATAQQKGLMSPAEAQQHPYPGVQGVKVYDASLKTEDQLLRQARIDREQTLANAEQARAEAEEARVKAAANRPAPSSWSYIGTRNGKAVYMNKQTGEERVGGTLDLEAPGAPGSGARAGVTPTQLDRDRMRNNQAYVKAEQAENAADTLRQNLGTAIRSGGYYVDAKGNPITWQKLIPQGKRESESDWQARIEKLRPQYVQNMRARFQVATKAADQATDQKNKAILANGGTPQVSTAQAIAARGGNAQPPQAQAARSQKPQANAPDPVISVKLPNGQSLSGPRSKMTPYLRSKGLSLQQQ